MAPNKVLSRRFFLVTAALFAAIGGMFMDKDVAAFGIAATGLIGAYGYTRSKWGASDGEKAP